MSNYVREPKGTITAGRGTGGQFATHRREPATFNAALTQQGNPATPTFNRILNTTPDEWFAIPWRERKPIMEDALLEAIEVAGSKATFKGWSQSRKTLGRTHSTRNLLTGEVTSAIDLSDLALRSSTPDTVAQTITHEIAHSISSFQAGHGQEWADNYKAVTDMFGIDAHISTTLESTEIEREQLAKMRDQELLTAPWLGTCPQGHQFPAGRQRTRTYHCVKCRKSGAPSQITFERNPNRSK